MEQLLRGEEISAMTDPATPGCEPGEGYGASRFCDRSAPILYFPVRHHSPVCSFHLKKAIEAYGPDCILIEGPKNTEHLIPVLVHPDTLPPLALYYAYRDKEGLVSPDKEDYKCYYPFLDCSPELVALREAARRGIEAHFIDLPYMEILAGTAEKQGIRREGEKQTYNDDYLLSRSRYLQTLCERTGLRDFEEFWEKYFEIQGLCEDTVSFIRQMRIYCDLARLNASKEELEADGTLLRERYMAGEIAGALADHERILVVTGGFHTSGLEQLLEKSGEGGLRLRGEPVRLHRVDPELQTVYPMAYSMEAADALNGYASGMQSPGFYDQVWKRLEEGEEPEEAYRNASLHFLALTGRRARAGEESVSTYDEICALSMAEGLAALRGKKAPGLYELRDSALSSFVKGECSMSTDRPLRILGLLTTGEKAGSLCADAMRPPLLEDFERQCTFFGLKIHTTAEQETVLQIFARDKHRRLSRFFYQTEFLGCGFARRRKGSDLVGGRDRNRVREIWTYRWSAGCTAALIDASVYGATVEEAARSCLYRRFGASAGCKEAAELLVKGFLMGLTDEQDSLGAHLAAVLAQDGDFFSLAGGFSQLVMLSELQDLYRVRDRMDLEKMIRICFEKLLQLLPFMGQTGEDKQQECMECLRSLYQATGKRACAELRETLAQALERMLERRPVNPAVEGAALGLLYGCDGRVAGRICDTARGYVQGTKEMRARSAAFLRGLFFTARDFVFAGDGFVRLVDELLGRLPVEEFMGLLPELRLAFGYFTPMETDRIAGQAAALHGKSAGELIHGRMVSPEEYAYGERLDGYIRRRMEEEI